MIKQTFRVSAINNSGEPAMCDFSCDEARARAKAMFDANVSSGQWAVVMIMVRTVAFAGGQMSDTGFVVVETTVK